MSSAKDIIYRYWGKARPDEGKDPAYHLLPYHCLDVAAVGDTLLMKDAKLFKRIETISGIEKKILRPTFLFFLCLHDIGKFSMGFQNVRPDLLMELQGKKSDKENYPYHDTLGFLLWDSFLEDKVFEEHVISAGDGDHYDEQEIYSIWAKAFFGHHGKPPETDNAPVNLYFDKDTRKAVMEFTKQVSVLFFGHDLPPLFKHELSNDDCERHCRLSWYLAGMTVLCDWIGSDERYFKFHSEPISLENYWRKIALPSATDALFYSGILIPDSQQDTGFSKLFPKVEGNPSPLQEFSQNFKVRPKPQLLIFEDMTGSGKTEAALIAAHRLINAGLGEGVFVALPTMATANAMFERIQNCYRNFFNQASNPSLILAHSARMLSNSFTNTIGLENIPHDLDDPDTSASFCSAWLADNRKKSLMAAFGVGTIDQALLGVLPSRHQCLRLLGLGRNILIVDEVHSYDPYIHSLLCRLLEFQAAQNGSAILLSATLPMHIREELVNAFGRGLRTPQISLEKIDYPMATLFYGESPEEGHVGYRKGIERRVKVKFFHSINDVVDAVSAAAKEGACVCWVRNTVSDALEGYQTILDRHIVDEKNLILFHARFALCDRQRIENEVLRIFGKTSGREIRIGKVVVATQVLEQSLDLDFDFVISDLAPIELILQRAGRCQRHARKRPSGFLSPCIGIFSPSFESTPDEGWYKSIFPKAAFVYPFHGRLWLGGFLLKKRNEYSLPEDSRDLVESVYGQEALDIIPAALQEIDNKAEGEAMAQGSLAAMNALNLAEGYQKTHIHWQDDMLSPTRLGEPTRTLRLARWDGQGLIPWAEEDKTDTAWALSEVSIRESIVKESVYQDKQLKIACEKAKDEMKDNGRWSVLVPLEQENGVWRGIAKNVRGKEILLVYDKVRGLIVRTDEE